MRAIFILILSVAKLYFLVACKASSNISLDYNPVYRSCAPSEAQIDQFSSDYALLPLGDNDPRNAAVVSENQTERLELTPAGCVWVPKHTDTLAIFHVETHDDRKLAVSMADVLRPGFRLNQLVPINLPSLDCPKDGLYANETLNVPTSPNAAGIGSRSYALSAVLLNPVNGKELYRKELKPIGFALSSKDLIYALLEEGTYNLVLEREDPFGQRSRSASCQLTVIKQRPHLIFTNPDLAKLGEISLPPSNLLIASSPGSLVYICIKAVGLECEVNDYLQTNQLVLNDDGRWNVAAFAVDRAGNRSELWQQQITVDPQGPKMSLELEGKDSWTFLSYAGLKRPLTNFTVKVNIEDNLSKPEDLAKRLECRAYWIDGVVSLQNYGVRCLSGSCRDQLLDTYRPCDLRTDIGLENIAESNTSEFDYDFTKMLADRDRVLKLSYRVRDETGYLAEADLTINYDKASALSWSIEDIRSSFPEGNNQASLLYRYIREQRQMLIIFEKFLLSYDLDTGIKERLPDFPENLNDDDFNIVRWRGAFWIFKGNRLYQLQDGEWREKLQNVGFSSSIRYPQLAVDKQDHLIMANRKELKRWDGENDVSADLTCDDQVTDDIMSLQYIDGKILILSSREALVEGAASCERWSFASDNLGVSRVQSYYRGIDGELWALGNRFLMHYQNSKWNDRSELVKGFQTIHTISAITEDSNGQWWIVSDHRIFHINPDSKRVAVYDQNTVGVATKTSIDSDKIFSVLKGRIQDLELNQDGHIRVFTDQGLWLQQNSLVQSGLERLDLGVRGTLGPIYKHRDALTLHGSWGANLKTFQSDRVLDYYDAAITLNLLSVNAVDDWHLDAMGRSRLMAASLYPNSVGNSFSTPAIVFQKEGRWDYFESMVEGLEVQSANISSLISIDDRNIFAGSQMGGVLHYQDAAFTAYSGRDVPGFGFYVDRNEVLWTTGGRLHYWDGHRWVNYREEHDDSYPFAYTQKVFEDSFGAFWALGGDSEDSPLRLAFRQAENWVPVVTGLFDDTPSGLGILAAGIEENGLVYAIGTSKDFAIYRGNSWHLQETTEFGVPLPGIDYFSIPLRGDQAFLIGGELYFRIPNIYNSPTHPDANWIDGLYHFDQDRKGQTIKLTDPL